MSIAVRILADSINPAGSRITSWLLTYPRFIHSEFMTHRVFSRNAASSRARPRVKMIEDMLENPAMPEFWSAEHKGMKAIEQVADTEAAKNAWLDCMDEVIQDCDRLSELGLAKSICNRVLEPFSHITVLATATDHSNFFSLRAHPDAEPTFQVLAYRMLDAYLKTTPVRKEWGEWHIPLFGTEVQNIYANENDDERIKVATARCARLSYLTHDGEHSPEKDIEMHDRLLGARHLSPFEHCAQAVDIETPGRIYHYSNFDQQPPYMSGWQQYRKTIENEGGFCAPLSDILATKPDWIKLS